MFRSFLAYDFSLPARIFELGDDDAVKLVAQPSRGAPIAAETVENARPRARVLNRPLPAAMPHVAMLTDRCPRVIGAHRAVRISRIALLALVISALPVMPALGFEVDQR